MIPLSTFLFELILNFLFFFGEAFWFFYLYHLVMIAQTPPPLHLPHHTPSCDKSLSMQNGAIPVHWPVSGLNIGIAPSVWVRSERCSPTLWQFPISVGTRKRFCRCKLNFQVHTSTSCFFHCVRRNRSHTSQRRYWYRCPLWRLAES